MWVTVLLYWFGLPKFWLIRLLCLLLLAFSFLSPCIFWLCPYCKTVHMHSSYGNCFGRSLMKLMNSVGPLWNHFWLWLSFLLPSPVLACFLFRKSLIHFSILSPTPFWISFRISPSFCTLLNAFVRSKKVTRVLIYSQGHLLLLEPAMLFDCWCSGVF